MTRTRPVTARDNATRPVTARDNVTRALAHLGLDDLIAITREEADRVFGWPDPRLRERLEARGWLRDPNLIAGRMHGSGSRSYRDPSGEHPAMQIVFHPDPRAATGPGAASCTNLDFVEIDLDFSAPGVDVADTVRHLGEVAHNAWAHCKTDQNEIARMLDRRFGKDVPDAPRSA